jgi:hypothetical protein
MRRIALATIVAAAVMAAGCGLFRSSTAPSETIVITTFTADSVSLTVGQSTTLRWAITPEDVQAHIDPVVGDVPANGSKPIAPTATTTYTLRAFKGTQSAYQTITVAVK